MRQRIDRQLTKEYILKTLPSLPKDALKEIQNSLNFFLSGSKSENTTDEELFYEVLRNKFEKELRVNYPIFNLFRKQTHYKKFKELTIFLLDYLQYNLKGVVDRKTKMQ